ncbi:MAG: adenylate/guanylate cyclase domain-containing protein, partial [Kiloniellales bacterium]|nr:adenylate/guanylate cyclase domain-containing protein [Kiloniellales bacterium]
MERRLAAILAADVVGYARLMSDDETGTLERLKALRRELVQPGIAEHKGRVVKLMGDGILAEFPSVVEAIQCAVRIQQAMRERETDLPDEQRIKLRIGVNLGDIILEGSDIYGEGVNVAARLETLADPGGICVSQSVNDQVEGKVEWTFESLGPQAVKNIPKPVQAFRVLFETPPRRARTSVATARRTPVKLWALAGVLGTLVILAGAVLWQSPWSPQQRPSPTSGTSSSLSEKPRVAVLPFDDYGGDPSTSRLAKGLTEDIITDLARFPEFSVIARNSTEIYENKAADLLEVGAALSVDFVLEGAIQRDGDHLRISAQLIDVASGSQFWSERWDRPAEGLFVIQSEIAEAVANRLGGGAGLIQQAGRAEAKRKLPESLDAYELYLLGTESLEKVSREGIEEAIGLLTRAVEIDPGLARAWVELYHAHNLSRYFGTDKSTALDAAAAAAKAIELDPSDAEAHAAQAMALADKGEFARAKAEFETALRMAPNAFEILAFYSSWAGSLGEPERGAELAERAVQLNPSFPDWAASPFAWAFFTVGRYEDAVQMLDRLPPESYTSWRWAVRAGSLAALGRSDDAAKTVGHGLEYFPDLTIEGLISNLGLTDIERGRWVETMRLAGFPAC